MNASLATQYYSPVSAREFSENGQIKLPDSQLLGTYSEPRYWFEKLLQGQRQGRGCLPLHLGLTLQDFVLITAQLKDASAETQLTTSTERGNLRQDLMDLRIDEWEELRKLVSAYSRTQEVEVFRLPEVVAAGCLGGDHLWRDLGFLNRAELSEFMQHNFPGLAALNCKDMKWKKFFYKQLCEQEGGYVCRSPSCEVCTAYDDCFGSED